MPRAAHTVLFLCVANSARSQLAEGLARMILGGRELHHDTLYHLGIAVPENAAVVRAFELARAADVTVIKPPRPT